MHFATLPGIYNHPKLKLNTAVIRYTDTLKFFRLLWDTKLT